MSSGCQSLQPHSCEAGRQCSQPHSCFVCARRSHKAVCPAPHTKPSPFPLPCWVNIKSLGNVTLKGLSEFVFSIAFLKLGAVMPLGLPVKGYSRDSVLRLKSTGLLFSQVSPVGKRFIIYTVDMSLGQGITFKQSLPVLSAKQILQVNILCPEVYSSQFRAYN